MNGTGNAYTKTGFQNNLYSNVERKNNNKEFYVDLFGTKHHVSAKLIS